MTANKRVVDRTLYVMNRVHGGFSYNETFDCLEDEGERFLYNFSGDVSVFESVHELINCHMRIRTRLEKYDDDVVRTLMWNDAWFNEPIVNNL